MNQTWQNGKKPSFKTKFGLLGPNLGSKLFFHEFYLYYVLDIVARYHSMQFQGKLMNQKNWENGKKPSFETNFYTLAKIWAPNFFLWILPLLNVRLCCKLLLYTISRKTIQTWDNGKKRSFRTNFGYFGPNLGPQIFSL